MNSERSLYPRMVISLLALLGLLVSGYLALTRFFPRVSLVCLVGSGCDIVQRSPWSTIPPGGGIPISVIGIVGYVFLLGWSLLALQTDHMGNLVLPFWFLLITSVGLVFSIYLFLIQRFMIQAFCTWCVISGILMIGIWVAALLDWRDWQRITQHSTSPSMEATQRAG